MKISAVTICVHYSDYLECILSNRLLFDHWLVITTEDDENTRGLCSAHDIHCLLAKSVEKGGLGFNSASNKSGMLNEGLQWIADHVGVDTWVAVVDADVYLPKNFRQRLAVQELDKSLLYGLAARRICDRRDSFELLRDIEPWDTFLERNLSVIGYFNLFYMDQPLNRYPASKRGSHDDWRFWSLFGPEGSRQLPITCLHVGAVARNWAGRNTDHYSSCRALYTKEENPRDHTVAILDRCADLIGDAKTLVQLGFYDSAVTRHLAQHFERVFLVDRWGLLGESVTDDMTSRDRRFLRREFLEQISGAPNVEILGGNRESTASRILDASIDAIYFDGEVTYDFLLNSWPTWSPKVKDGGHLIGKCYAMPALPDSTHAIHHLLGTPDRVVEGSGWILRVKDQRMFGDRDASDPGGSSVKLEGKRRTQGVVVFSAGGRETGEQLSVALHRLRKHWHGAACVIRDGTEIPSLRVVCAHYGVKYFNAPGAIEGSKKSQREPPHLMSCLEALKWCPYEEAFLLDDLGRDIAVVEDSLRRLRGQNLVFRQVRPESDGESLRKARIQYCDRHANVCESRREVDGGPAADRTQYTGPIPQIESFAFRRESPWIEKWAWLANSAWRMNLPEPCLLPLLEHWDEARPVVVVPQTEEFVSDLSSEIRRVDVDDSSSSHLDQDEIEILARFSANIRVRPDTTIVFALMPEDLAGFRRNWVAAGYDEDVPIVVFLLGFESSLVSFLPKREGLTVIQLPDVGVLEEGGNAYWDSIFLHASLLVSTRWWVYLDPAVLPQPGAQLYCSTPTAECVICSPGWAFRRVGDSEASVWERVVGALDPDNRERLLQDPRWKHSQILQYFRIGPPATLVSSAWARHAVELYERKFAELPLELFLNAFAEISAATTEICSTPELGWHLE